MVDFRITTPKDNVELSFDLNNNVKTNANHVNASTDSILKLAQSTGLVEAMHQVNQESAEADQAALDPPEELEEALPEEEFAEDDSSLEEEAARKRERKQRRDSRVEETHRQMAEVAKERDAYALKIQEMEVKLLKKKKEELSRDFDHLSSVMLNAKVHEDPKAYVEANTLLSQLTHEQFKTHESLEKAANAYQTSYEAYEAPVTQDPSQDPRYHTLQEMSHKRELSSEAYHEWLEDNAVYNPYSEDFNPRLAKEFSESKHEFNNYLYAHGQHSMIGTEAYYEELNDLIRIQNEHRYGSIHPYHTNYSQGEASQAPSNHNQPYYGEEDMSQPISRASVAPVNRQGYQNPYAGTSSSLPELTEAEKRIAEICPMTDVPTIRGVQPRYLSNEEKYAIYQQNKAKMMGMGT